MAKKKKSPAYLDVPAAWFRKYVQLEREQSTDAEARYIYERRKLEENYLKQSILLLRKHVKGFESEDGYDLREIPRILPQRIEKIRKLAPLIREEIASPHVLYRPRTTKSRSALIRHTGQRDISQRKTFVVHTPKPDATRIEIKGKKKKSIELITKVKGVEYAERFFYLDDYAEEPIEGFDDIIKTTRTMLPHMPRGYYVVETSTHGSIGIYTSKSTLIAMLGDFVGYDKMVPGGKDSRGLSQVIVGFKLVSSTREGAAREYRERLTNRQIYQRERSKVRSQQRRRTLKRLGR